MKKGRHSLHWIRRGLCDTRDNWARLFVRLTVFGLLLTLDDSHTLPVFVIKVFRPPFSKRVAVSKGRAFGRSSQ